MAVKGALFIVLVAIVFACADAHIMFSSVTVGGVAQPNGDCMRPHPASGPDSPIPLVTDADMTCGFLPAANTPANRKCPVTAGSKVGLQWWHYTPGGDIVDPSHKGPCIVYLAKSDTGAGNVWFKIYEDGYNPATKQWCVDTLIKNRGYFEVTIPADIAAGNYLLRGEIIALHGAYDVNGAQPYVHCAELTISGGGSANPTGVALPGYYKNTDPGLLMSIYFPEVTNYIIPGPAVYTASSSSGSPTASPTSSGSPTASPTQAPTAGPTQAPTPAPTNNVPATTITAYVDAVTSPFEDWSWASVKTPSDTTVKYEGTASYKFKPQSYQAVYLWCDKCIDTTKHSSVEFYINGGTAGGQRVSFNLVQGTSKSGPDSAVTTYTGGSTLVANTWVKGTADISNWAAGQYDGLWFQDMSGTTTQGDIYIDSIKVIAKGGSTSPTNSPDLSTGTSTTSQRGPDSVLTSSATAIVPALFVLFAVIALLL